VRDKKFPEEYTNWEWILAETERQSIYQKKKKFYFAKTNKHNKTQSVINR